MVIILDCMVKVHCKKFPFLFNYIINKMWSKNLLFELQVQCLGYFLLQNKEKIYKWLKQ